MSLQLFRNIPEGERKRVQRQFLYAQSAIQRIAPSVLAMHLDIAACMLMDSMVTAPRCPREKMSQAAQKVGYEYTKSVESTNVDTEHIK